MPEILLLVLLALALLLAAGLGLALRKARRATGEAPAIDGLLSGLREFVGHELDSARAEAQRSRDLMREAVAELHAALGALGEQSRQQAALVSRLVEQDTSGSPGMGQFALQARGMIAGLTQTLDEGSRESVKTVQVIDQMTRHLDGIFDLLGDLEGLAAQTARLAAGAAADAAGAEADPRKALQLVADEVRHLADRSADFNVRIRGLVGGARDVVARVRERVEATADRDMNASIEARMRVDGLAEQAVAINRAVASSVREATDHSQRMGEGVSAAARALAFEEPSAQALAVLEAHLSRLATANEEAARLRAILEDPAQSALVRERALERFGRQLRRR